jgi:hypothetical protein
VQCCEGSEESRGMCIGGGLAFEVITCILVYRIADFKLRGFCSA